MNMRRVIGIIFTDFSVPDQHPRQWYGYARNQLSNFALGISAASMASVVHFTVFGEFAKKGALWFTVALFFAVLTLARQGWHGKDTIEDWVFFSVYGAGMPIFLFTEITVGSPNLSINSQQILPLFGVMFFHMFGGVVARIVSEVRANEGGG